MKAKIKLEGYFDLDNNQLYFLNNATKEQINKNIEDIIEDISNYLYIYYSIKVNDSIIRIEND